MRCLLILTAAGLLLTACASGKGRAEDACRTSGDARSAACVTLMQQFYRDKVPSPTARPVHATKTLEEYRADRFECEFLLFGREGSTFGGDPNPDEVRRYYTQMRHCLEDKYGWRFE